MTTPKREAIRQVASKLFHFSNPHIEGINAEDCELKENGLWQEAKTQLMGDNEKTQYVSYLESELYNLGYRVIPERDFNGSTKTQDQQPLNVLNKNEQPQYIEKPIPFDLKSALETGITVLGTRQCGKTTLALYVTDMLKSQVANLIVYVIDPTRVWLTRKAKDFTVVAIPPRTREPVQLKWNWINTIFDTSMLSTQQQQDFTEIFCSIVLNTLIATQPQARPQVWIWFEEAHTPIPNFIFSSKRLQETKRLITQGANFSISFGIISQFPAMVDKLPVKATQQRYFGLTSEPNDTKYLRQYIGKEWASQLEDLNKGEFIYKHRKQIMRFQTPNPETQNRNRNSMQPYAYNYSFFNPVREDDTATLPLGVNSVAISQ